MEVGDEGLRMVQVCRWQPFVAGVGPAFKLDKVDKVAVRVCPGVEPGDRRTRVDPRDRIPL